MKQRVNIKTAKPDDALRVGDFALLPNNPQPPVITSHPIRNFTQQTWGAIGKNNAIIFKDIQPVLDVFTVRNGTRVRFSFFCVDPSNVNNINDTSNLTFVWKKDGNTLFAINNQNNGQGTTEIEFTEAQCTAEIEGEYVCEVSNEFGTTETVPFTLHVIDLDNNKILYTNLIKNGDGEFGLEDWSNPSGKILSVVGSISREYRPSTVTRYRNDYPVIPVTNPDYTPPLPFRFSTRTDHWQLFYPMYKNWLDNEPNLLNLDVPLGTDSYQPPSWMVYSSVGKPASIIPNEDIGKGDPNIPQGYFPAPGFVDRYNRNGEIQDGFLPLKEELKKGVRPTSYFTRDLIEFNEDEEHTFTQTIDISEASSLIDGQVGGVDYMTAQFFSYVGVALSRYKIRVTQGGNIVEYPWLIHDYETYKKFLAGEGVPPIICDQRNENGQLAPTPIEIIPYTDDTTDISIKYFDENLLETKEEVLKGPKAIDLWAVKEKVDIALMLFPIYAFFGTTSEANNVGGHDILIYNQKYTDTKSLIKLFSEEPGSGLGMFSDTIMESSEGPGAQKPGPMVGINEGARPTPTQIPNVDDINVRFLANRYGSFYLDKNRPYPRAVWVQDGFGTYEDLVADNRKGLAVDQGSGAEAFFAVGRDIDIPIGTRQISVGVSFKNNTPSRNDSTPNSKGWNSRNIYNNLFSVEGVSEDVPQPYFAYGEPRCAITKMKLQLVPNRDIASEKHSTYTIPPNNVTVAGIAKSLIQKPIWNTAGKTEFEYKFIQPSTLPPPPEPTLESIEAATQANTDAVDAGNTIDYLTPPSVFTPEEDAEFGALSIDQEGIDFISGDANEDPPQDDQFDGYEPESPESDA